MLSSELKEALDDPGFVAAMSDEELEVFFEDHPEIFDLVLDEDMEVNEAIEYLGELKVPKPHQVGRSGLATNKNLQHGNPGNDPFRTAPLHATSSAGKGGGSRPNPRTKTGECKNCKCKNYVCTCTCNGSKRTIDMTAYKARKKDYMGHWRKNHGPKHPR